VISGTKLSPLGEPGWNKSDRKRLGCTAKNHRI